MNNSEIKQSRENISVFRLYYENEWEFSLWMQHNTVKKQNQDKHIAEIKK